MTILYIQRTYYPGYTRGNFITETGIVLIKSQELAANNNIPKKSCIPEGTYTAKRMFSQHLGWVYRLSNTDPRTEIDIHSGNLVSQILGCIETGEEYGMLNGQPAILDSKDALQKLFDYAGDEFTLIIRS